MKIRDARTLGDLKKEDMWRMNAKALEQTMGDIRELKESRFTMSTPIR